MSRPTSLRYRPRLSLRRTRHVSTPHVNNPASSGSEVSAAGAWQTEGAMDRGRGPQIPALPQPLSGSVAVTRLPFSTITSLQGRAGPVFPRVESPDVQDQTALDDPELNKQASSPHPDPQKQAFQGWDPARIFTQSPGVSWAP